MLEQWNLKHSLMEIFLYTYDHIERMLSTPLSHDGDNAVSNIFNKAGRHWRRN